MNYYKFHIGDYKADTAHLSNEEDLCYRRLLDMYYDLEKEIPLETQWVAKRLRVGSEVVSYVLEDMFIKGENGWFHPRCNAEIAEYHRQADKNRENGKRGGRPKKRMDKGGKPTGNPLATQTKPTGNPDESQKNPNHKPETINQKPSIVVNPGFSEEFMNESWVVYAANKKNAYKSPTTQSVALKQLFKKSGGNESMASEALMDTLANGYQGFDWYFDKHGNKDTFTPKQPAPPVYQQHVYRPLKPLV